MTMQKYTTSEGKLEILDGVQSKVVNDHVIKNGKASLSEFSEEELSDFNEDFDQTIKYMFGDPLD